MDSIILKNRILCSILIDSGNSILNSDPILQHLVSEFGINENHVESLRKRFNQYFLPTFNKKWKNAFFNVNNFFSSKSNEQWLNKDFIISLDDNTNLSRKKKSFETCSERTKKRRSQDIVNSTSNEEIESTFFEMLKSSGRKDAIPLIKKILSLEIHPSSLLKERNEAPIKLSSDEALALILDTDLTVAQYNTIRIKAKDKNADIFPNYDDVLLAKKKCYPVPSSVNVTEVCASIELQNLLDHTVVRLMKIPDITISDAIKQQLDKLVFQTKWGADGTAGLNEYKQKFLNDENSDKYLFVISMVPLCLKAILQDSSESVVWRNSRTSSSNYCRPIKFHFIQETKKLVLEELADMDRKIKSLTSTEVQLNGDTYYVGHEIYSTMFDGKICQYATDTSAASVCPICEATPREMNNLEKVKAKIVHVSGYQYGLSTLHDWIRCMECALHISYRLPFQRWAAKGEDKVTMQNEKKRIQTELRSKLGLIVDIPKQVCGSSNDGNTSRRFFENYEIVSKITGIDKEFLKRIYIVLQTMASNRYIDTGRFRQYTQETAQLYVQTYPWYYMPVTLHKILIHGADIIDHFPLPIGCMSEEPQETQHKDIKRTRTEHTRKTSRVHTNEDMLHYLLASSDPYIASLRNAPKKNQRKLHPEAMYLLTETERELEIQRT